MQIKCNYQPNQVAVEGRKAIGKNLPILDIIVCGTGKIGTYSNILEDTTNERTEPKSELCVRAAGVGIFL